MENIHLSNSALKFAKLAKNSNVPTVLFLAGKKARHLLAPPSSIHVALFFSHGGIGSAERRANLAQNSSLIGHAKKLGTDIGHYWTFVFQFFAQN